MTRGEGDVGRTKAAMEDHVDHVKALMCNDVTQPAQSRWEKTLVENKEPVLAQVEEIVTTAKRDCTRMVVGQEGKDEHLLTCEQRALHRKVFEVVNNAEQVLSGGPQRERGG